MKKLFLAMIRFYRRHISPRKRGPVCRYIPSCSQYAVTAIERYGAWKGGWMALWRICGAILSVGEDMIRFPRICIHS